MPVGPSNAIVCITAPVTADGDDEVFQILLRPNKSATTDRYPATILYWSPSLEQNENMHAETLEIYPWTLEDPGGPGGTIRRPRINPLQP